MFRCEKCGSTGKRPNRLVVEKRDVTYPERQWCNREVKRLKSDPEHRHDPGGEGWEIAREMIVCDVCLAAARMQSAA